MFMWRLALLIGIFLIHHLHGDGSCCMASFFGCVNPPSLSHATIVGCSKSTALSHCRVALFSSSSSGVSGEGSGARTINPNNIAIIGGGLSGLSTAFHLLKESSPGTKVTILDTNKVGEGGASAVAGG
jgi:hypothetical protein